MKTTSSVLFAVCGWLAVGCVGPLNKLADDGPSADHAGEESDEDGGIGDDGVDGGSTADPAPGAARLARLTEAQYRNAVEDLTGHRPSGSLPVDYDLHGYTSVGAGELSIAPYDLELYEAAAWEAVEVAVPDGAAVDSLVGCAVEPSALERMVPAVSSDTGAPMAAGVDSDCVRSWVSRLVVEGWRRPAVADEVEPLVRLFNEVHALGGVTLATRAVLAAVLVSPDFLFRAELGAADPDDLYGEGAHRLTDWELASRLAFFLTDAPPDAALRAAASAGELSTEAGIRTQAERLLATERARAALTGFFVETLDLDRILTIDKDAASFPADSPALREAMRAELEVLFQEVALDSDLDMRTLLTTDMAWVTPELAALYGLEDVTETGWVSLPPDQDRGGLLGRAGFLMLNAAASRTSPTHRGKFVRTRLLCQDVPPPPEDVVASLDGIDSTGTLRDTLEQHMTDPACNSCHMLTDPIGFTMEDFDGLGAWRIADNGLPIDATGELDGVALDGVGELGAAVADHARFSTCLATQLYRHATGALEGTPQQPLIDELELAFAEGGHRFEALVLAVVTSPGFRGVSGPLSSEVCTAELDVRPCETECGVGVERCIDGVWQGCDADPVSPETCDGLDSDCDGIVDVTPLRACALSGLPGVQSCPDGAWVECEPVAAPAEQCNGEDDDRDGVVDEGLGVELVALTIDELRASHESCSPIDAGVSAPCNAAVNRFCAARGCDHETGFGLIGHDFAQDVVAVTCLDSRTAVELSTTFTELASHHAWCSASEPVSADCNASISRFCAAEGLTTGFGPLEHSADVAAVACTPSAEVHTVDYDELSALNGGCYWPENRLSEECNLAIHQWCTARDYATGFGPLENWDNLAQVACIPRPEVVE